MLVSFLPVYVIVYCLFVICF